MVTLFARIISVFLASAVAVGATAQADDVKKRDRTTPILVSAGATGVAVYSGATAVRDLKADLNTYEKLSTKELYAYRTKSLEKDIARFKKAGEVAKVKKTYLKLNAIKSKIRGASDPGFLSWSFRSGSLPVWATKGTFSILMLSSLAHTGAESVELLSSSTEKVVDTRGMEKLFQARVSNGTAFFDTTGETVK